MMAKNVWSIQASILFVATRPFLMRQSQFLPTRKSERVHFAELNSFRVILESTGPTLVLT